MLAYEKIISLHSLNLKIYSNIYYFLFNFSKVTIINYLFIYIFFWINYKNNETSKLISYRKFMEDILLNIYQRKIEKEKY